MVLEKTLESLLDCKEIQPVHPKGNQPWIFIARTDAEAEIAILWPPDAKNWLTRKDPDPGKDWRQEEKGITQGKTVGWHHRLNRHGSGWTPGVGDGQGILACCMQSMGSQRVGHNWSELVLFLTLLNTYRPFIDSIWLHAKVSNTSCHHKNKKFREKRKLMWPRAALFKHQNVINHLKQQIRRNSEILCFCLSNKIPGKANSACLAGPWTRPGLSKV